MTKYLLLVVVVAGLLAPGLFVPAAMAQQPAGAARGSEIAVIDIGYIFKNHPRFKADMTALQGDVEREEARMKKEQDNIRSLLEQQKGVAAGSEDHRRFEEEVVRRRSEMAVTLDLQRKKFMKEEANIYHTTYREIEQEVSQLAAARGIAIVLKYNADNPDPANPQSVVGVLNKQIVWSHRSLDITQMVLQDILRRLPPENAAAPQTGARQRLPDNFQR